MPPQLPRPEPQVPARQSRVTLGPGGVLYLVVSGLIFAAAVYTQANLLFAAFGLVMGGLVVSAAWSVAALRKLEVRRVLPTYGVAGRPTVLRYEVRNGSRLPVFSLVIAEAGGAARPWWRRVFGKSAVPAAEAWVVHVGPGQTATAEAPCWPSRRGPWVMSAVEAWSAFPFGVFRKVVRLERPGKLLVLPEMHRMDGRLLHTARQTAGLGTKQRDKAGGHGEFFGLRAYRAGDPPRLIDWKRTARQGRLVAREFTQPSPPRVVLLLDLSGRTIASEQETSHGKPRNGSMRNNGVAAHPSLGSEAEEGAVALTASLVAEGYRRGFSVGLVVLGPPCTVFAPHHSRLHRTQMLEALAALDLSRRGGAPDVGLVKPTLVVRPGSASEASENGMNPVGDRGVRVVYAADWQGDVVGAALDPADLDTGDEARASAWRRSGAAEPGRRAELEGVA